MLIDATLQLTATVAPEDATDKTVDWSSSNPAIVTVSNDGLVTAKTVGTATITVNTTDGDKTDSIIITVTAPIAVNSIDIVQGNQSIAKGATLQLTTTFDPSDATNTSVTWTSDDATVASVSTSGLVTANKAGTATITVTTTDGNKTDSIALTVTAPIAVNGIDIVQGNQTIAKGATLQLTTTFDPTGATNKNVSWTSSDETVATVSTTGLVTTLKTGTATITVTTADGSKTDTVVLTVTSAVTGVTINENDQSLPISSTLQLHATIAPSDATDTSVSWTSDDATVASVSSTGLVTAHKAGVANITVTTTDGSKTDTVVMTVTISVNGVSIVENDQSIAKGATLQLTTTFDPMDATNKNVSWTSSDETVATISTTGFVSALKGGTATITVTTADGSKTDSIALTIIAPVEGVSIVQANQYLVIGDTKELSATVSPIDATNKAINWSSSDTDVASVDANGLVTAKQVGLTRITVTTNDGNKTGDIDVSVSQGYIRAKLEPSALGLDFLVFHLTSGPHVSGNFEGYVLPDQYEIPISVEIPANIIEESSPAMTMYYGSSEPAMVISADGDFGSYASSGSPFNYSYCMFPQLSDVSIGTPTTEYSFGIFTKDKNGLLTQRIESTGNSLSVVLTDKGSSSGYVAGTITGPVYDTIDVDYDNDGHTDEGVPYTLNLSFKVPLFLFPSR